jgi:hypothetical protein
MSSLHILVLAFQVPLAAAQSEDGVEPTKNTPFFVIEHESAPVEVQEIDAVPFLFTISGVADMVAETVKGQINGVPYASPIAELHPFASQASTEVL